MTAKFPVLMYHSVPESDAGGRLTVPRQLVDRQWRALKTEGWMLRGLTEALSLMQTNKATRVIGLTFDDGFADFIGVLDLLAKHDARATVYIPTSQPRQSRFSDGVAHEWLSWAELASLPRDLVEVGSHAHLHRPLDILRQEDVDFEVSFSRRMLSERIGLDVTSFCYPNGYSSPRVRRTVSAAGYANACVVGRRLADPDGDQYKVPRLQVTSAHEESKIISLVCSGESGLAPPIKIAAHPAWRVVRQSVYRLTGHILTLS
jgi:peptidoglycan/xylan/chitin deacetylase (PgdA/CDA1 family)